MNTTIRTSIVGMLLVGLLASAIAAERAEDRLFLTWERDPTATMTFRWLQRQTPLPVVTDGLVQPTPYAIPLIETPPADADAAAWWEVGLAIDFLLNPDGQRLDPAVLGAAVRLAWSQDGLLLAVRVRDPAANEADDIGRLWAADSLEIFPAAGVGSELRYQVVIAPGRGPSSEPRQRFYRAIDEASVRVAARPTADGYHIEVLLPWSNLPGFTAEPGATPALQFYINARDDAGQMRSLVWYPATGAHTSSRLAHGLRLAETAGDPVRARSQLVDDDGAVRILAAADRAGETVALRAGPHAVASTTLEAADGRAEAVVAIPEPPTGHQWGALEAFVDDRWLTGLAVPLTHYPSPEPITLRYWPEGGDAEAANSAVFAVQPVNQWHGRFIQHLTIDGLEDGRSYSFTTSNQPTAVRSFRTLPAQLDRPLRFLVGGDTMHERAWMDTMTRIAVEHMPEADAVIWGGDFAYANGSPALVDRWDDWFDVVHDRLITPNGRVLPLIVCIGNHEVWRGYVHQWDDYEQTDAFRRRMAPYYYQFFPHPGQPGYATLDVGDYLSFLLLDTDHTNPILGQQTEWLAQVLAERRGRQHILPIYHIPAYPSHRPFRGRDHREIREHWLPLFEEAGVRLAFEHHDHTYKRTEPIRGGEVHPQGIVFVGDGSWGVDERTVHPAETTWYLARSQGIRHAIMLTIDGPEQRIEVVSREGAIIDAFSTPLPE